MQSKENNAHNCCKKPQTGGYWICWHDTLACLCKYFLEEKKTIKHMINSVTSLQYILKVRLVVSFKSGLLEPLKYICACVEFILLSLPLNLLSHELGCLKCCFIGRWPLDLVMSSRHVFYWWAKTNSPPGPPYNCLLKTCNIVVLNGVTFDHTLSISRVKICLTPDYTCVTFYSVEIIIF